LNRSRLNDILNGIFKISRALRSWFGIKIIEPEKVTVGLNHPKR
jgi:hypothetical protein